MQILSQEALKGYRFLRGGQGQTTPFYESVRSLEIGQSALISMNEWPNRMAPGASEVRRRVGDPNRQFSVRMLADKTAFAIVRIK